MIWQIRTYGNALWHIWPCKGFAWRHHWLASGKPRDATILCISLETDQTSQDVLTYHLCLFGLKSENTLFFPAHLPIAVKTHPGTSEDWRLAEIICRPQCWRCREGIGLRRSFCFCVPVFFRGFEIFGQTKIMATPRRSACHPPRTWWRHICRWLLWKNWWKSLPVRSVRTYPSARGGAVGVEGQKKHSAFSSTTWVSRQYRGMMGFGTFNHSWTHPRLARTDIHT